MDRGRSRERDAGRASRTSDRSRSRERDSVRSARDEDRPMSRDKDSTSGRGRDIRSRSRDRDSGRGDRSRSRERDIGRSWDGNRSRSRERDPVPGRSSSLDRDRPRSPERELEYASHRGSRDKEIDYASHRGSRDKERSRSRERERDFSSGSYSRERDRPSSRERDSGSRRASRERERVLSKDRDLPSRLVREEAGSHVKDFGGLSSSSRGGREEDILKPRDQDREYLGTKGLAREEEQSRSRERDKETPRGGRMKELRRPLSGERDHDFGTSREEERPMTREREFSGRVSRERDGTRSKDKQYSRASSQERELTRSAEAQTSGRKARDSDRPRSLEREVTIRRTLLPISRSREGSREREPKEAKEMGLLERGREEHMREMAKLKEKEEREARERELKEKERKEMKERELERQRERELAAERDQKLKEREEKERERDRKIREKEAERERTLDSEKESDIKRERHEVDRHPRSRRAGSVDRSRSGSRSRKWSRSPVSKSRSRSRDGDRSVKSELLDRPPEPPLSDEEDMEEDGGGEMEEQELYEPIPQHPMPRRSRRANMEDGETYEDISSDEEMEVMDVPNMMQVMDMYEEEEEEENDGLDSGAFNPMDFYLTPLCHLKSPALSNYESEAMDLAEMSGQGLDTPIEAQTLMDMLHKYTEEKHHDGWVEAMEEIPKLLEKGLCYLLAHERKHNVLDVLVDWAMEGCDQDLAMSQPDAAFKVRHLKSGIKLSGLLCACDESIALALLRRGLQSQLLSLFESQLIVFSIKHLALRALSRTAHFPCGIQWFLGIHPEQNNVKSEPTSYQRLVQSLLKPKIVKLTMSGTALLKKIHYYETLTNLYKETERVVELVTSQVEEEPTEEEEEEDLTMLKEEDETKILANLAEITQILAKPEELIGQASNAVPYSLLVDAKSKNSEAVQTVYNIAESCRLLESVLALLMCPATASVPSVYLQIHTLLQQLMETQNGILFLASQLDTTNSILRCLMQSVEETEDSGDEIPFRQLGMEMVYHLQAIQYIDHLLDWHLKDSQVIDEPDVISVLHGLHTMTFTNMMRDPLLGKTILSKIVGFSNNMEALLPFLEKTGDDEYDGHQRKSVSVNYTIQILLNIVKTSTNVNMLQAYAPRILAVCENSSSTKLSQLAEWLAPTKKLTSYDLDGLPAMIAQLKLFSDDIKKVPPGLITVIRVIHSLLDFSHLQDQDVVDSLNEAKYRYTLVELYSADCFPIFINILQKLSESQLKVWQQGIPYTTDQWLTYFSLIRPTLSLVRATLCQLIQAFGVECINSAGAPQGPDVKAATQGEGEEEGDSQAQEPLVMNPFRDLTTVPVLLEIHTVMCSVPTSSLYNADLGKIQKDIVDTLLAFTQEELQQTQTDDALNKSLWTLMLKELLKYTIKSPYTYMSGLLILSELLPLPFPLHTKEPLSDEEIDTAIVSRKLWSVHLQAATPELTAVLETLSGTGCQPLQHLLRRVCWQIADLAAPSSLRVTKILLDILMVNLKPKKPVQASGEGEKKEGEEEALSVRSVSIHTAKTLNLLAYLLSHPGIKGALLQLIGTSICSDVKYKDFLAIMLQLLNQTNETPAEIQAQEGIVSMIQSLCDLEVSMVNTDLEVTLAEHLANSLPEGVLLGDITTALLEHIGNTSQNYASILPCLRILSMLTEHDYGFYHLKKNLESNLRTMPNLLNRINNTFSKDSSDCLSTLSAVLELLRLLTSLDPAQEEEGLTRSKVISREELEQFLLWNPEVRHPLEELEELLKEEETLESILQSITALTSILRDKESPQEGDTVHEEIVLPVPASLPELFKQRAVSTFLELEDERLSPSYWLANPAVDEPDADPEVLRCDLQAICEQHLPDFNLEQELKKEATTVVEDIVRPKRPKDRRKSHEVINIYRGKPGRKPFVAPMRGRGIMTHGMSNRSNDLFRTRAPNTSRPPSMHVDDFVKMENSQHHQQQQPAQQQQPLPQQAPPPPRPPLNNAMVPGPRDMRDKESPRMRGGFDRARGSSIPAAGRFFTPPGFYGGRREPLMHDPPPPPHMPPHQGPGGSRGGMMPMERNRPNFMSPRQFSRGRPERSMGPPHLEPHGGGRNGGRFSPNGRRGRGAHWGRGRDMMEPGRFASGFQGRRDQGRHLRSFTK